MNKYGLEHFHIEEIENVENNMLDEREKYWIKYYNSYSDGYNATIGGDGKTLINYKKVLKLYDTTSLTSSEIAKILDCSIDSIKNIVSQYRDNIDWEKRYYSSELHNHNLIAPPVKVRCIEENLVFNSTNEAAKWLVNNNKSSTTGCRTHISACCKGKRKTCGGYHWEYF